MASAASDPRVRIRFGPDRAVEVVNETADELEVDVQDGGLHWSWEPDDPSLGEDPRREASGTTRHWCPMGLFTYQAAARMITWVGPLNPRGPSRLGRYVGRIELLVTRTRGEPVTRYVDASFRFEVVADPSRPSGRRLRGR